MCCLRWALPSWLSQAGFSTTSAVVMKPLTLDEHGRMSYRIEHRVPQEIDGQITVHPKVVNFLRIPFWFRQSTQFLAWNTHHPYVGWKTKWKQSPGHVIVCNGSKLSALNWTGFMYWMWLVHLRKPYFVIAWGLLIQSRNQWMFTDTGKL